MEQLYTEHEVADLLRIPRRSVQKARLDGRLPYSVLGRHIRISETDLQRFIAESKPCQEKQKERTGLIGTQIGQETEKAIISTSSGRKVVALDVAARARQAARRLKRT